MRKKAINIIMADLESPETGLHFDFFYFWTISLYSNMKIYPYPEETSTQYQFC